jgi:soluble lytic murein transglycosylase-like protein
MALLEDAFRRFGERARELDQAIEEFSSRFAVPTNLSRAIAFQESSYNPDVPRGSAGEIGPFQVLPATANWVRSLSDAPDVVRTADITTLSGNAAIGIYYLALQLRRFGDPWRAVAAYNAGPTRVASLINQWGTEYFSRLPVSTQRFVTSVQKIFETLERESHAVPPVFIPPSLDRWLAEIAQRFNVPKWVVAIAVIIFGVLLLVLALKG